MAPGKTFKNWSLEIDEAGIAWLACDKRDGGANVLSAAVLSELDAILAGLPGRHPAGLVIHSAKPGGFIAGADIGEFRQARDEADVRAIIERGQKLFERLETLHFPTVAMIHGFCLGGGLELAMACHYRVASDDAATRLGLPEVKLGIHPGFGGTMRLLRLLGAPAALDLMLNGRSVDARRAARLGLVDVVTPGRHLRRAALDLLHREPPRRQPMLPVQLLNAWPMRELLAAYLRRRIGKKVSPAHYPAPFALLELWRRHGGNEREMVLAERDSVTRLARTPAAANLVRLFFLQERLKGLGRASDFRARRVHVIGAGAMGGDIAAWCALRGLRVSLQDREPDLIAPALARADRLFARRLHDPVLRQAARDRLRPDPRGDGIPHADVVIEAISEDLALKQALFRDIEARLKPGALLATNTSSIVLARLGEALADPGRLLGLHFFNPVARMQLVEVISGGDAAPQLRDKALAFVRQIGRLPLPVRSSPGFLVNRILLPYLLEAVTMYQEGTPAELIDHAARQFGMPLGPVELADAVGLDVCLSVGGIVAGALGISVPEVLRGKVEQGLLGKKRGAGFYQYDGKGRPRRTRVSVSDGELRHVSERLVLRIVNEAVACLREGLVEDADLLDAGMVFGTGFAPFRGGPIRYLQEEGGDTLRKRLEALADKYGERFRPDPGWDDVL